MRGAEWAQVFAERMPELPFRIWPNYGAPAEIRFLAAWQPPDNMLWLFPNLEILFSVGAGVDQFDLVALPPGLPVVRMIEPGIAATMVEYVTLAVLALHRDLPVYIAQQREAKWRQFRVRPASERRVGVLGLGRLGQAALRALGHLGFRRAAWSRTRRAVEGVACHAGVAELGAFLARWDILVCLLPLTPETRGILDRNLFYGLPRGAGLVNVGRGAHLVAPDSSRHSTTASYRRLCWMSAIPSRCPPEIPCGTIRGSC